MSPTKDLELTPAPPHFTATSSPARSQAAVDSKRPGTSGTSELPPHVQPILHSTGIPAPDIGVGSVVRHLPLVENQSDQRNLHMSHRHGYKSKPVLPHVQFPATFTPFSKSTREVASKTRERREEEGGEGEGERGDAGGRGGREEGMVGRGGGGGEAEGKGGSRDGTPESWHSLPLQEEGVEKEASCFQQGKEAASHTKTEGMVAC